MCPCACFRGPLLSENQSMARKNSTRPMRTNVQRSDRCGSAVSNGARCSMAHLRDAAPESSFSTALRFRSATDESSVASVENWSVAPGMLCYNTAAEARHGGVSPRLTMITICLHRVQLVHHSQLSKALERCSVAALHGVFEARILKSHSSQKKTSILNLHTQWKVQHPPKYRRTR